MTALVVHPLFRADVAVERLRLGEVRYGRPAPTYPSAGCTPPAPGRRPT